MYSIHTDDCIFSFVRFATLRVFQFAKRCVLFFVNPWGINPPELSWYIIWCSAFYLSDEHCKRFACQCAEIFTFLKLNNGIRTCDGCLCFYASVCCLYIIHGAFMCVHTLCTKSRLLCLSSTQSRMNNCRHPVTWDLVILTLFIHCVMTVSSYVAPNITKSIFRR